MERSQKRITFTCFSKVEVGSIIIQGAVYVEDWKSEIYTVPTGIVVRTTNFLNASLGAKISSEKH